MVSKQTLKIFAAEKDSSVFYVRFDELARNAGVRFDIYNEGGRGSFNLDAEGIRGLIEHFEDFLNETG